MKLPIRFFRGNKTFQPVDLRISPHVAKNVAHLKFTSNGSKLRSEIFLFAGVVFFGATLTYGFSKCTWTDVINLDSVWNGRPVTVEELNNRGKDGKSVWVSVNKKVYDLTNFIDVHPGGARIIERYSGKDASPIFNKYHSEDFIQRFLSPENYVGDLVGEFESTEEIKILPKKIQLQSPSLAQVINLNDFEKIARSILSPRAWAYYSTGANDEITMEENEKAYRRIFFKPKVLVKTEEIDISTSFLGQDVSAPFYCSAAAQARMGHVDGELSIARGCGKENIIQMISSVASYSLADIAKAHTEGPSQWFQLYVVPDREISLSKIAECESRGIKGIFVTVDTAWVGQREKDLRLRISELGDEGLSNIREKGGRIKPNDPLLTWEDISNFKKATSLPIAIKGIQRVEDVLIAIEQNVDAVVLSNHGGRQLDYSRPPIEVLAEVSKVLKEKNLDKKIEIYIDGGVRRGSDVVKALCLGAKGVGLGRTFLYANSAYGEEGVTKAIEILKGEILMTMKLLGVKNILELHPDLLDLRRLQFPTLDI